MSALLSMVVALSPRGNARFESGDAVQGWILGEVRRRDAVLAERLHANQGFKPYTVSPLKWAPEQGVGEVRLTALGQDTAAGLMRSLCQAPSEVGVGSTFWSVRAVSATAGEHPWARSTTTAAVMRHAVSAFSTRVSLTFHSPTAFGGHGDTLSLFPESRLVFRSLSERWRALHEPGMPPLPEPDWWRYVHPSAFELSTAAPQGRRRHVSTGFVGTCAYTVERGAPGNTALWMRACAALAFYCGVGMGTARGMGQVEGEWL